MVGGTMEITEQEIIGIEMDKEAEYDFTYVGREDLSDDAAFEQSSESALK